MNFTDTQRAQIRLYLGYPDIYRYKNTRLESVLSDGVMSDEAITLVASALASLVSVEAAIVARGVNSSGIKAVDEIEFFQNTAGKELRDYGRMYASRIGITLGVPKYSDVFGNVGYLGDQFSAGGLGAADSGRGNLIPLG